MSNRPKETDINWYNVLHLSMSSTTEEIEKAARQLAKKYHPDRNKDEDAPQKFLEVQKAKGFLLDEEKRRALDAHLSAGLKRKAYESERVQTMDASRKRLREEFEKRVAAASAGLSATPTAGAMRRGPGGGPSHTQQVHVQQAATGTETVGSMSMSAKLSKLRQEGRERTEAVRQEAAQSQAHAQAQARTQADLQAQAQAQRGSEIKVKWRRNPGVVSESDESLRVRFRTFGEVERVSLHRDKGNQATIVFAGARAAQAAVDFYANSSEYRVSLRAPESQDTGAGRRARIFAFDYHGSSSGDPGVGGDKSFKQQLHHQRGGLSLGLGSVPPPVNDEPRWARQADDAEAAEADANIFIAKSVAELKTKEAELMARLGLMMRGTQRRSPLTEAQATAGVTCA